MTLTEFLSAHDRPGAVTLLEGKRKVLAQDVAKLEMLGRRLAASSHHMQFRSGNAPGADHHFSLGVAEVDASRLQVIIPYTSHRSASNLAARTYSLDDVDLLQEPELVYATRETRSMASLVDGYVSGKRGMPYLKASYLLRDTAKVLGARGIPPASFAIFYDDLAAPGQGGTGHTMRVCVANGIPMVDQRTWFAWLDAG
jgi:hypothetical protein